MQQKIQSRTAPHIMLFMHWSYLCSTQKSRTTMKSNLHFDKPTQKHFSGYSIKSKGVTELRKITMDVTTQKRINLMLPWTMCGSVWEAYTIDMFPVSLPVTIFCRLVTFKRCCLIQNFSIQKKKMSKIRQWCHFLRPILFVISQNIYAEWL